MMVWFLLGVLIQGRIIGHDVLFYPDGDGLILQDRKTKERFITRFCGIDCPEHGQEGMKQARLELQHLIQAHRYTLVKNGFDIHGRTLISLVSEKGETISTTLVKKGLCYIYPQFLDRCPSESEQILRLVQKEALQKKRGLLTRSSHHCLAQSLLNNQSESLELKTKQNQLEQSDKFHRIKRSQPVFPWEWRRNQEKNGIPFIVQIQSGKL